MELNKIFDRIRENNLVLQIRYDYPDFMIEVREHGGCHREITIIGKETLDKDLHPDEMITERILKAIKKVV